jgi:hypothetical protein
LFWPLAFVAAALPTNLIILQTAIGALAVSVVYGLVSGRIAYRRTPMDLPLLFFLLVVAGSMLASPRPVYSWFSSTSFWVFLSFFFFSQAFLNVERPERLYGAFLPALAVGAGAAVFASYQHFHGTAFPWTEQNVHKPPFSQDTWVAIGHFTRHSTLAFVLMLLVITAMSAAGSGIAAWKLAAGLALCLPMLPAMFYTYVRTAWIGLVLALLVLLALSPKRKIVALALALVCAAGAIAALSSSSVLTKLQMMVSRSGDNGRAYIWRRAMEMAADSPASGIGFGNFSHAAANYYDKYPDPRNLPRCHAHNVFLHYMCEAGPLGLFAFLFLFAAFFAVVGRALFKRGPPSFWSAALRASAAAVSAVLASSLAQCTIFDGQVVFFTIFLMSAGVAGAIRADEDGT